MCVFLYCHLWEDQILDLDNEDIFLFGPHFKRRLSELESPKNQTELPFFTSFIQPDIVFMLDNVLLGWGVFCFSLGFCLNPHDFVWVFFINTEEVEAVSGSS